MNEATSPSSSKGTAAPVETVQQIIQLLSSKSDTSRLVGLAVLKPFLDNSSADADADAVVITQTWHAISGKFLDRLLQSGITDTADRDHDSTSGNRNADCGLSASKDSTAQRQHQHQRQHEEDKCSNKHKHMRELAVSVLHAFLSRLPSDERGAGKMAARIGPLVHALPHLDSEAQTLALQALVTIVASSPSAARNLLFLGSANRSNPAAFNPNLTSLVTVAPSQPLALDVFLYAWLTYAHDANASATTPSLEKLVAPVLRKLSIQYQCLTPSATGPPPPILSATSYLTFLTRLLSAVNRNTAHMLTIVENPTKDTTSWIYIAVQLVRWLARTGFRATTAEAATLCSATLVGKNPLAAYLLFAPTTGDENEEKGESTVSSKPTSYLLLAQLLADIRATVPSLLHKLQHDAGAFTADSRRITAALDLVVAWISVVLAPQDDDNMNYGDQHVPVLPLPLPPALLLSVRTLVPPALMAGLEYVRERWDLNADASEENAAGARLLLEAPSNPPTQQQSHMQQRRWLYDYNGGPRKENDGAHNDSVVWASIRAAAAWCAETDDDEDEDDDGHDDALNDDDDSNSGGYPRGGSSGVKVMLSQLAGDVLVAGYAAHNMQRYAAIEAGNDDDPRRTIIAALSLLLSRRDAVRCMTRAEVFAALADDLLGVLGATRRREPGFWVEQSGADEGRNDEVVGDSHDNADLLRVSEATVFLRVYLRALCDYNTDASSGDADVPSAWLLFVAEVVALCGGIGAASDIAINGSAERKQNTTSRPVIQVLDLMMDVLDLCVDLLEATAAAAAAGPSSTTALKSLTNSFSAAGGGKDTFQQIPAALLDIARWIVRHTSSDERGQQSMWKVKQLGDDAAQVEARIARLALTSC